MEQHAAAESSLPATMHAPIERGDAPSCRFALPESEYRRPAGQGDRRKDMRAHEHDRKLRHAELLELLRQQSIPFDVFRTAS
jgi:hypothetical protein